MCDETVVGGYQTIDIVRKKGENIPVTTYGFLLAADADSVMRLVSDMKAKNIESIGIATTFANDPKKMMEIRKLTEISFFGTDKEVILFCQGKQKANEKPTDIKVRDYETLKISTKSTDERSYAEMAGKIKESLDPTSPGVVIKDTKKDG